MNSSVLAYLENSAEYFPEKCAVTDEKVSYSYSELVKLSSSVGEPPFLNLSHREMQ